MFMVKAPIVLESEGQEKRRPLREQGPYELTWTMLYLRVVGVSAGWEAGRLQL